MIKQFVFFILFIFSVQNLIAQKSDYSSKIDEIISAKSKTPFNGVILVSQNREVKYAKAAGFSELDNKTPLNLNDEFVVGSISKQFTAVLVLREYDKGSINLFIPIRRYLPELAKSWAGTVTIQQLLTHTHGITSLDDTLEFKPGTKFSYSQLGYDLLAKIAEKTSGKSFAELSAELFKECKMEHSFHPDTKEYHQLVKGYTEVKGTLQLEKSSFENYPAAGTFVSTASDLMLWNEYLHNGKLLKPKTYKMMISKQPGAIRQHPLFGNTNYGLGITIDDKENMLQLGQTGFAPGFASMDFYFPENKISVIVLENIIYNPDNLKKIFKYHLDVLKTIRESELIK